jgi:hypothetical protein
MLVFNIPMAYNIPIPQNSSHLEVKKGIVAMIEAGGPERKLPSLAKNCLIFSPFRSLIFLSLKLLSHKIYNQVRFKFFTSTDL